MITLSTHGDSILILNLDRAPEPLILSDDKAKGLPKIIINQLLKLPHTLDSTSECGCGTLIKHYTINVDENDKRLKDVMSNIARDSINYILKDAMKSSSKKDVTKGLEKALSEAMKSLIRKIQKDTISELGIDVEFDVDIKAHVKNDVSTHDIEDIVEKMVKDVKKKTNIKKEDIN